MFLVRRLGRHTVAQMITEVEAYDGLKDKASHAHRGKTARNAPMFEKSGRVYVYFTYGMHWMLNIVTGPKNYPAAVLIRSTDKVTGPARLTKALRITGALNNKPLGKSAGLWIENRGVRISPRDILRTPRIGVAYAGPIYSKKLYRFVLK